MRLYLTHLPECGATEVRLEIGTDFDGNRLFAVRRDCIMADDRHILPVAPGHEPPLYCPPIPDAEMARLLGIEL